MSVRLLNRSMNATGQDNADKSIKLMGKLKSVSGVACVVG